MTTSGVSTYSTTELGLIEYALSILAVYGEGLTLSSYDKQRVATVLNMMLKSWNAKGGHVWCRVEGVLFYNQYTYNYNVGETGTSYATKLDDLILTQLSTDHIAGDTVLTVNSTVGMQVNDYIGVVLTDRSIFWSTIGTIDSGTSLTMVDALPGEASSNRIVYTFTTKITKPYKIKNIRTVSGIDSGRSSTLQELPVYYENYNDFMKIPVKTTNSDHITQATFNANNTTTDIYVFPRPSDCGHRMYFTYARSIEDLINSGDNPDAPSEWFETIAWQVAVRIATMFGRMNVLQAVAPIASQMLTDQLAWDQDNDYMDMEPDLCN